MTSDASIGKPLKRSIVLTSDRLPKASVVAKGGSFKEVFQGEKSNNVQHQRRSHLQEPTKRYPVTRLCWLGPLTRSNHLPLPQIARMG